MAKEIVRVHGYDKEIYMIEAGDKFLLTEDTKINLLLLHGMNAGNIQSIMRDDPVSQEFYDYYVRTPREFVAAQVGSVHPLPRWSERHDVYPIIAVPVDSDGTPIAILHQWGLAWGDMAGNFITHDHFHGEHGEILTSQPRPELLHEIKATKRPYADRNDRLNAYFEQTMNDALTAGQETTHRIYNRLNPLVRKTERALADLYEATREIAIELGIPETTFERLKTHEEKKKIDLLGRQEAILLGGEYEAPLLARVTRTGQPTP